jgi:phage terminase small subunit
MATLPNARREKFCQFLAEGNTAEQAYALAGYKPNRANASVLKSKQNISVRVAELLNGGAERAQVTVKSIIENLQRIAKKAEDLGDARGLQAARASWEGIARISGLIVERHEVGDPGEFGRMTDAELDASLQKQASALGLPENAIEQLIGSRGRSAPGATMGRDRRPAAGCEPRSRYRRSSYDPRT